MEQGKIVKNTYLEPERIAIFPDRPSTPSTLSHFGAEKDSQNSEDKVQGASSTLR